MFSAIWFAIYIQKTNEIMTNADTAGMAYRESLKLLTSPITLKHSALSALYDSVF